MSAKLKKLEKDIEILFEPRQRELLKAYIKELVATEIGALVPDENGDVEAQDFVLKS